MSIHVIQGKPGGGKSYQAVQRALDAVKSGRVVVTNLPLKTDHPVWVEALASGLLVLKQGVSTDLQRTANSFAFIEGWESVSGPSAENLYRNVSGGKDKDANKMGPLIIVDEAAGTLGEWSNDKKRREEWGKFVRYLQVHRHYLQDVIFLYQDYSQLTGAQGDIKGLVERWYTTTNTSEMTGFNSWNMVAKAKGFSLSRSANLDEKSGRFQSQIFDLYDSYAEGQGAGTKGKKSAVGLFKAKPLWARWWFILLILCFMVLPYAMWKTSKNIVGVVRADHPPAVGGQPPAPGTLPAVRPGASAALTAPAPRVEGLADRQNPRIMRNGVSLPAENLAFKGFDQNEIFFVDGSRFGFKTDFEPAGYRILKLASCDVIVAEIQDRKTEARELLRYHCERGF